MALLLLADILLSIVDDFQLDTFVGRHIIVHITVVHSLYAQSLHCSSLRSLLSEFLDIDYLPRPLTLYIRDCDLDLLAMAKWDYSHRTKRRTRRDPDRPETE